ncbi:hypothetical protein KKB64_04545 [Patescibacteria group bacterium]|nr:hypothetical protein [Patescibacteria group bacterium]
MSAHRGEPSSDCSGSYYAFEFTWKMRGSKPVEGESSQQVIVCEEHRQYFLDLGIREGYKFEVNRVEMFEPVTGTNREKLAP